MTATRALIIAASALAFAVAGCGGNTPPSVAAPASATPAPPTPSPWTSPTPSPVADPERATCRQLTRVEDLGTTAHTEPALARPVAEYAVQAKDSKMYAAGVSLTAGIDALEDSDPFGNALATMGKAWNDIARACIRLYGDGPWN